MTQTPLRYRFYPMAHFTWARSHFHQWVFNLFIRPYVWFRCRPIISGREHVPAHGPFIVASNHISLFDPPLVSYATAYPTAYMAKQELFKHWFMAEFFRSVGCFSLNRELPDSNTIKSALNVLRAPGGHWALGLFPEGTRNKTGQGILPLKKGLASLSQKAKCPIVPVGIYKLPSGQFQVRIGRPILPKDSIEETQDDLYKRLCELTLPLDVEAVPPIK